MPIIKSAIKRVRQQATRRSHNLQVKRAVHQDTQAFTAAIARSDAALVAERLRAVQSEIDRAVKKGTLHKNTAARQKSRLAKQAAPLLATAPLAKKPAAKTVAKAPARKPAALPTGRQARKPAAKKTAK